MIATGAPLVEFDVAKCRPQRARLPARPPRPAADDSGTVVGSMPTTREEELIETRRRRRRNGARRASACGRRRQCAPSPSGSALIWPESPAAAVAASSPSMT